jgi:hypothetical protein
VHVNIADPTQLSVVDSGYVEEKIIIFYILNRTKDISFVHFSLQFLPGPARVLTPKPQKSQSTLYLPLQENSSQSIGSAVRQKHYIPLNSSVGVF